MLIALPFLLTQAQPGLPPNQRLANLAVVQVVGLDVVTPKNRVCPTGDRAAYALSKDFTSDPSAPIFDAATIERCLGRILYPNRVILVPRALLNGRQIPLQIKVAMAASIPGASLGARAEGPRAMLVEVTLAHPGVEGEWPLPALAQQVRFGLDSNNPKDWDAAGALERRMEEVLGPALDRSPFYYGGSETVVRLTKIPPPAPYPPVARAAKVQGKVMVRVSVNAQGIPESAIATSGPPVLRRAAEQYFMACRWDPLIVHGAPSPGAFDRELNFNLTP